MHWRQSIRRSTASGGATGARSTSSGSSRRRISTFLDAWEWAFAAPVELIVKHFEKRIFELAMAIAQLGEGILLTLSPRSLEASSFHFMLDHLTLEMCVLLYVGVGTGRIIALYLNGHWMPYGAWVRVAGAAIGAFLWLQMVFALLIYNSAVDLPYSPGIPVYATLVLFEIVSGYRAIHGLKRWRIYGQAD